MPDRTASPFRLSLEQQRRRAKELLNALCAGDPDARHRLQRHHPSPPYPARLSDAQLVIARELGLPTWPRLEAHIEALNHSRGRIQRGDLPPDRGATTLHIRCGSDIQHSLTQAGFSGDFLEYADPLCQGPVLDTPDWLERRADFVAHRYGTHLGQTHDQVATKLRMAEQRLQSAATRYDRITLWFEHDSYDQLILARCLARFAEHAPPTLDLISPAHYPGGVRFIGLGQLPPEALRLLWDQRTPVPAEALRAGQHAWTALRAPDPRQVAALAAAGTPGIPQLGRALRRHCQEFPSTTNGLGLTQHLTLQLLAEQPQTTSQLFARLMTEREPLPWMSDLIFRAIVEDMQRIDQPVFAAASDGRLTITALGHAILAGETDWLSLCPPPRWLGGVLIPGGDPCWRWDEPSASVMHR